MFSNSCDSYFRYTSLEETVDRVAGGPNLLSRDQLFRYKTRGKIAADASYLLFGILP
jgi:hypothetical protein